MSLSIEPSWEVFDECPECFAGPKQPCYRITASTKKKLRPLANPHRSRKKLPKNET